MKRTLLSIALLLGISVMAAAQPRAVGARIGGKSFDINYQHSISKNFIDVSLSVDFPYGQCWQNVPGFVKDGTGFSVSSTYNFVLATPAWTDKGNWGIYCGPGLALGYVQDFLKYKAEIGPIKGSTQTKAMGFMMGVKACIGLEYTFDFPLQLAVEMHPVFGFHCNEAMEYQENGVNLKVEDSKKTTFYGQGLYGFIPSIAVRYRF